MEEFSEEKYPFKCNSCPLKFFDMEGANLHFLDGHENQKEVEIEELPQKSENNQTSEFGNPCGEELNEKQKEVENEELPQVVGQIVKAASKVKKSSFSEKKVIYQGILSTGRVV